MNDGQAFSPVAAPVRVLDSLCPYCFGYIDVTPADGMGCPRCGEVLFLQAAHQGFYRFVTRLHKGLREQNWPSYLTREQCLKIVGMFQFDVVALEHEIRLGARHDTEATLMLLAGMGSSHAKNGADRQRALKQLDRMASKRGFTLPESVHRRTETPMLSTETLNHVWPLR